MYHPKTNPDDIIKMYVLQSLHKAKTKLIPPIRNLTRALLRHSHFKFQTEDATPDQPCIVERQEIKQKTEIYPTSPETTAATNTTSNHSKPKKKRTDSNKSIKTIIDQPKPTIDEKKSIQKLTNQANTEKPKNTKDSDCIDLEDKAAATTTKPSSNKYKASTGLNDHQPDSDKYKSHERKDEVPDGSATDAVKADIDKNKRIQQSKSPRNYNYYEPLYESDSNTMPIIQTKKTSPRAMVTAERTPPKNQNPPENTKDDEGWTPVTHQKPRKDYIANPYASLYSPYHLPNPTRAPRNNDVDTEFSIQTCIKIRPTKPGTIFNLSRILFSVLVSLQESDPDVSLSPVNRTDNALPRINSVNDIPSDSSIAEKYLENPRQTKFDVFMGRILINTNHELHTLKENRNLRNWLNLEKITLEFDPLLTKSPVNVGFLYNVCPREDTMNITQLRLEKMLKELGDVEFLASKQMLFAGTANKSAVVMIRADESLYDPIKKKLKQLNDEMEIDFWSWKEFLAQQRLEIVNNQNDFLTKYRTLSISGFADADDDIPMIYHDEAAMSDWELQHADPLENIGVSDYMLTVLTGKGNPMFKYVYAPVKGIRELLVHHEHVSEALEYIKVCHGEMSKVMNDEAINLVFLDPDRARQQALTCNWEPFTMARLVPEAITTAKAPRNSYNNRKKHEHNGNYLKAATNQLPNAWQDNATRSTTSGMTQTQSEDKAKIASMERTIHEMKQTLEQTRNHNNNLNMCDEIIDKKIEDSVGRLSKKRTPTEQPSEQLSEQLTADTIKEIIANELQATVGQLGQKIDDRLAYAVNHFNTTAAATNQANGTEGIRNEMREAIAVVDHRLQGQLTVLTQTVTDNQISNNNLLAQLMEMRNEDKHDKRIQQDNDHKFKMSLQQDMTSIKITLGNLTGPGNNTSDMIVDEKTHPNSEESKCGPGGTAALN
jgi:hypothetical protein